VVAQRCPNDALWGGYGWGWNKISAGKEDVFMDDELNRTDINTAESIELRNVPGIGSKLADRIIAARPFTNLVDLRRVGGVGPALFEQLKPYVTVSPISVSNLQIDPALPVIENNGQTVEENHPGIAQTQPESVPTAALFQPAENPVVVIPETPATTFEAIPRPMDEPLSKDSEMETGEFVMRSPASDESVLNASNPEQIPEIPSPVAAAPTAVQTPQTVSKGITRAEMWAIAAVSSVFSFILAVFFTLIILGSINGTLRFVRPVDFERLASQVNTIDTQANSLRGDIDSLKTRVSTVEGLDGRVNNVEQNAQQLRKDLDSLSASANTLGKRIDDLAFQTDALVTRTARFQSFLDGLRSLLGNLNPTEVP
jgi:prefoldin subunit 5